MLEGLPKEVFWMILNQVRALLLNTVSEGNLKEYRYQTGEISRSSARSRRRFMI